jgi:hypothetical protein
MVASIVYIPGEFLRYYLVFFPGNDDIIIWVYGYFFPSNPSVASINLSVTP